jgi:hypothetical protein
MGPPINAEPDTWREDYATLLGMQTVYPRSVWLDAFAVIEDWADREEAAQTIVSCHHWLYPPSFARLLKTWRT